MTSRSAPFVRGATVITAMLLCTIGAPAPAHAGTLISVTTTADELAADGECSLREAVLAANANVIVDACPAGSAVGTDAIILPAGTYQINGDPFEDAGRTGDLDITSSLSLSGALDGATVLQGGGDRVLQVHAGAVVDLAWMTVTGGVLECLGCPEAPNGGGILNAGELTVRNTTISGNNAGCCYGMGGGIANSGQLTILNSTISGNRADGEFSRGGGIFNSGTVHMEHSTVTGNDVGADLMEVNASGGGLSGPATIRGTIIAGNTFRGPQIVPFLPSPDCGGTLESLGFNIIGDTRGCQVVGDSTGDQIGVDPHLGPLSDNGGPTSTHALLPGSPAIDAGNPAPIQSNAIVCPPFDQRGAARPQDGNGDGRRVCDIGSFERSPSPK